MIGDILEVMINADEHFGVFFDNLLSKTVLLDFIVNFAATDSAFDLLSSVSTLIFRPRLGSKAPAVSKVTSEDSSRASRSSM
ncbi:MAG: hypothetical protein ABEN55_03985 [Bradymonadaceae bacterium]